MISDIDVDLTKKTRRILYVAITLALLNFAFIGLLLYQTTAIRNEKQSPPLPFAALQNSPGGCSQCLGNNCYSAPCNLECRLVGPDSCETIVMGGGQFAYTPETKASSGDYAEFFIQRVTKNNAAMAAAGIQIGDTITHINSIYAGSDLEFAKLVLSLPRGTKLTILKANGERKDVTL